MTPSEITQTAITAAVGLITGGVASFLAFKGKARESDSSLASAQATQTAQLVEMIQQNAQNWQNKYGELELRYLRLEKRLDDALAENDKLTRKNRTLLNEIELLKDFIKNDYEGFKRDFNREHSDD